MDKPNRAFPNFPWWGVHVLVNTQDDIAALTNQVPALAKLGVNLLIPEINYNFAYRSHPELQTQSPVTYEGARRLAQVCRQNGVRLTPQFQCLGHQSWAETTFPLLVRYPEFDETPGQYPNNKDIYCRSWCPQHPGVNPIIFDLFDELIEAFEADALHVGMDEVFLIASEFCPRCKGQDPARLFAKAVNDYHDHLVKSRRVEMMMWGDRLLDGVATGYGMWEAAENGTHPAIDLIPKDIILCDWHYTLREEYPSIPIFLDKGFRVIPGGWREEDAVEALIDYAERYAGERMLGYLSTTWGAVKISDLAGWAPILKAQQRLKR